MLLLLSACGSGGDGSGGSTADGGAPSSTSGTDAGAAGAEPSCGSGPTGWVDGISLSGLLQLGVTGTDRVVYTGSSLIAWGGRRKSSVGAIYDFASRAWRRMSLDGGPLSVRDASVVWAGDRMLVWGGATLDGIVRIVGTGAAYDPVTDRWTPMSTNGAPDGRRRHSALWTGTRLIVWGGTKSTSSDRTDLPSGALYDPATNTWTQMSPHPQLTPPETQSAMWTGTRMVVVTAYGGYGNGALVSSYDPSTDTWTSVCSPPTNGDASNVWDGDKSVLTWGGFEDDINGGTLVATGSRVDLTTCAATPAPAMSTNGAPTARQRHSAVWTGSKMIVFGGLTREVVNTTRRVYTLGNGAAYDPASDAWAPLTPGGTPGARYGHQAIWTGTEMIVWGGFALPASEDAAKPTACVYRP